jgi:MFS family permease
MSYQSKAASNTTCILSSLLLLSWAISFETNINLSLSQNVTNTFGTNNLISLLPTVLYILQTALLPIYSKLSNMFGRAQCYTVALTFYIVSYIVMATAPTYYTIVVRILHNAKPERKKPTYAFL